MVAAPNRDRLNERREATRREIVDAAWEVAREEGLAQLTLRAVATRVGMQPPSLYSHFPAKHAIYDAMFEQAWEDCDAVAARAHANMPDAPRPALRLVASTFFDYAVADFARHQLMSVRVIPGFEPSPQSYAAAVRVLQRLREVFEQLRIDDPAAIDLWTAVLGGLIHQQWANDPGGDRWRRLLGRAVDMFADEMGLPGPRGATS